jgi:hypothetical protein
MDATVAAAAIGVGGTVIVGLAGFWASVRNTSKTTALTLRAVEITEQGQVTDRYTKAIEQLGSDKLDVRIGSIYALERVARDSPRDHPTIMEVLAAFIREHSQEQWPLAEPGDAQPQRETRPDVQAAATVIGRRTTRYDGQPVNLVGADLTFSNLFGADRASADLTRSNLFGANLVGANLAGANLAHANLAEANFTRAFLADANLADANLAGANLVGAFLASADLADVEFTADVLTGTGLTIAELTGAGLAGVELAEANLTRANLTSAKLNGAFWPRDAVVPEGWERDADLGRLAPADASS